MARPASEEGGEAEMGSRVGVGIQEGRGAWWDWRTRLMEIGGERGKGWNLAKGWWYREDG